MSTARHIAWLACISWVSGCGLVAQGTKQTLTVNSTPPEASFTFSGQSGTTPATLTLNRRRLNWSVYRVEKEGFQPACAVVFCGTPKWIKVVDSIFLAIPLLVDLAAGSMRACQQPPNLTLVPITDGQTRFALAPDAEILKAWQHRVDMCSFPYFYDPNFGKAAEHILVTTGDLQRPYRELGQVDVGQTGFSVTQWTTIPIGNAFAYTAASHSFAKATPAEINALMQRQALLQYGDRVDAVLNVDYQTNPKNDVYGTGIAVQFVDAAAGTDDDATIAERLDRLKAYRDQGTISAEEYERRRVEILREL